ncbi:MAG TPA: PDZ domain-containing protein, partial [Tepidiformaceae bacterium]|nr:PDZ domain-containing protein [Tepidiformaceae bacterium]
AGGPVATAGMQAGDVIVRIGDYAVRNEADLAVALIRHSAGETVEVDIYRNGRKQTLTVTLGVAPTT